MNPDQEQIQPQPEPELQLQDSIEPQVPYNQQPAAQTPKIKPVNKVLMYFLAVSLIIAGLLGGLFIGFAISFSSCYKSDCGPVEEGAMLWLPIASLFVTVPASRYLLKDKNKD